MCEFCSKHKRKKWFLDSENYEEKMLEDKGRQNVLQKITGHSLEYHLRESNEAMRWTRYPVIGEISRMLMNKMAPSEHAGQIITLNDALEIIDLSDKHVLFSCMCKEVVGLKEEMCCLNFGPMRDLHQEVKYEKMEEIDSGEAKLKLKEWHNKGLFQQVLYAKVPFPVAICNCERKYCLSMKYRLIFGIKNVLLKGHEIAVVNPLKCRCEEFSCMSRCQFEAMYVDRYSNKMVIDPTKCFGCGLCVNACRYNAITLDPKEKIMGKRIKW